MLLIAASHVLLFEETEFVGFFSRQRIDYFLEAFFYALLFVFIFVPRCRRLSYRETMMDPSAARVRQFVMINSSRRLPPCDRCGLNRFAGRDQAGSNRRFQHTRYGCHRCALKCSNRLRRQASSRTPFVSDPRPLRCRHHDPADAYLRLIVYRTARTQPQVALTALLLRKRYSMSVRRPADPAKSQLPMAIDQIQLVMASSS